MVDARSIIRGALTRTLPGTLLGNAGLIALSSFVRANLSAKTLALTVVTGLAVCCGSALTLLAMRSRLRTDAGVTGRRSFVVGLGAFCVGLTARPFLHFVNPRGTYVLMGAAGAMLAGAVFFPWLQTKGSVIVPSALNPASLPALGTAPLEVQPPSPQRVTIDRDADV
jgi:hypothetical protein